MKLASLKIVIFYFLTFVGLTGYAQNNESSKSKELDKLDSLAFVFYEKSDAKNAEITAYKILDKLKNRPANLYQINAYTLLGIINKNRGYYISSLENYIHALNLSEKIKDKGRVSACLNNIGVIYQLQKNYKQAIKYFSRSLQIEEKGKNQLQKSIRYYNLGDSYKELKKYDFALSYFNNSLIIEEKFKNNEGIIFANLGIVEVYLNLKNEYQAKMILDKIEKIIKNAQLEENIVYSKLQGQYNFQVNNFGNALSFLSEAEDLSLKNQIWNHILDIYLLKIAVFEAQNNIANANNIYKKYILKNNELTNSEIKNQIEDLTYKNELTKKELEIKLVQEERNLALKNEKYEQKITWFVLLILLLSIGLILFGIKKLTSEKQQ